MCVAATGRSATQAAGTGLALARCARKAEVQKVIHAVCDGSVLQWLSDVASPPRKPYAPARCPTGVAGRPEENSGAAPSLWLMLRINEPPRAKSEELALHICSMHASPREAGSSIHLVSLLQSRGPSVRCSCNRLQNCA